MKLNELEKVINQYQEKLNDVTQSYQQKIGILENKIIDKELETGYSVYVSSHFKYPTMDRSQSSISTHFFLGIM